MGGDGNPENRGVHGAMGNWLCSVGSPDRDGDDDRAQHEREERVQATLRPLQLGSAHAIDDDLALGLRLFGKPGSGGGSCRWCAQRRHEDDGAHNPEWREY
jgi:hypothetical protein